MRLEPVMRIVAHVVRLERPWVSVLRGLSVEAHPVRITFGLGIDTFASLKDGVGPARVIYGLAAVE